MRIALITGLLATTAAFGATPAQAQGGAFMWCMAWTEGAAEKAYYYSGFFAAGAWEAERKASEFKVEVKNKEAVATELKATCMAPADHNLATGTRNAAMKSAPGKIMSWEG